MHEDLTPLGIPLYPSVFESGFLDTAALALGSVAGVKNEHPGMRQAEMSSHDSFDAVYGWYRQKMPAGSEAAAVAASNHTDENGDRMAFFEVGTVADPAYQRVMIAGKAGDPTLIQLIGHVTK